MQNKTIAQILNEHYFHLLQQCYSRKGQAVSAGEYAEFSSVSRSTAKERLSRLIKAGMADTAQAIHTNKSMATYYYPKTEWIN